VSLPSRPQLVTPNELYFIKCLLLVCCRGGKSVADEIFKEAYAFQTRQNNAAAIEKYEVRSSSLYRNGSTAVGACFVFDQHLVR